MLHPATLKGPELVLTRVVSPLWCIRSSLPTRRLASGVLGRPSRGRPSKRNILPLRNKVDGRVACCYGPLGDP